MQPSGSEEVFSTCDALNQLLGKPPPQRYRKRTVWLPGNNARGQHELYLLLVWTRPLTPPTTITPPARADPLPPISTSTFSAISGESAKVKNGQTHCGHPAPSLHLPPSSHQGIVLPFALPNPATPCSTRVFLSSAVPSPCDIKQAWTRIISP